MIDNPGACARWWSALIATAAACAAPPSFDGKTDVLTVASEQVGDTFEIEVHQPNQAPEALPVVFVLDGSIYSEDVAAMAQEAGVDVVVVGVGYDDGISPNRRRRDYTPSVDPFWQESGGLPAFRLFLLDTLLPLIEQDYAVSDERALFGHSLGGLATMEILWQQDPAAPVFTKAVASSPALHWDLGLAFDDEQAYAAANDDLPVEVRL